MRLGLLICDHVSPEFAGIAGDYPDMFDDLFSDHATVELVHFDVVNGRYPASLDDYDGWITTGSRQSVNDDSPWISWLEDFVRRLGATDIPFLGVCFGHQMMAKALGGSVARSDAGWGVGIKHVEVIDPPPAWLDLSGYRILNSHRDQVTDLPRQATVIGSNDHCPVSMMTVGSNMLGLQGHPEFSVDYSAALIRSRKGSMIPPRVADAGLASLGEEPDNQALATALVRFAKME